VAILIRHDDLHVLAIELHLIGLLADIAAHNKENLGDSERGPLDQILIDIEGNEDRDPDGKNHRIDIDRESLQ